MTEIEVRRAYLAKLPSRLADLERAAAAARTGGAGREALVEVHGILHRMVGTGGSLGLTALARVARSAEDLVAGLIERADPFAIGDREEFDRHLAAVGTSCREALATRSENGAGRAGRSDPGPGPQRDRRR